MKTKQRSILLVEDDPDDRLITRDAFHFIDKSIRFQAFTDGENALQYLSILPAEQYPSLVLLDYNTPRLNGLETLQKLKADTRFQHLPVAMFTTSRDAKYRELCLQSGAGKYYFKPFVYSELVTMVKELLEWLDQGEVE